MASFIPFLHHSSSLHCKWHQRIAGGFGGVNCESHSSHQKLQGLWSLRAINYHLSSNVLTSYPSFCSSIHDFDFLKNSQSLAGIHQRRAILHRTVSMPDASLLCANVSTALDLKLSYLKTLLSSIRVDSILPPTPSFEYLILSYCPLFLTLCESSGPAKCLVLYFFLFI